MTRWAQKKLARSTRMNSRNSTKMVEHKLILFVTVRTLWTLLTLLIKLFRILLKWKYIQDQNYTILPLSGESEAILSKMFCPGHRAGVYIWENFHPGYRDLGRKNQDLGKRASSASHNEHIDIFTKKRVGRRDLGNRASPVDQAHMKRP